MTKAIAEPDIELTAHIVSAYVSGNPVPAAELTNLIAQRRSNPAVEKRWRRDLRDE